MPDQVRATHIVGGEITYKYLGNDIYHIKLKLYRDCHKGLAIYDTIAAIGVFNNENVLVNTLWIKYPGSDTLKPELTNPCLSIPPDICVQEAIYEGDFALPPMPGGYQLAYQRCCRNHSINNIVDPGATGATYHIAIKDTGIVKINSSPYFNNFPPILICQNEPLIFDHSATDPDGDSLVYALCMPYHGAETTNPMPQPPNAPPYAFVTWQSPFSTNDPLGGVPLKIDPQTGLLTATPSQIGQFVVGICVEEYRNGVLLSTNKRDFQFNVRYCPPVPAVSVPSFENHCGNAPIKFNSASLNAISFNWDFGISGISTDTSSEVSPTYTFPDTGSYKVQLIVNKNYSCADTSYTTINVWALPKADFSANNGCRDVPLLFKDNSKGNGDKVTGWKWDFNDGSFDNTQNPSHLYVGTGLYSVMLTATTFRGCKDSLRKNVVAYDLPIPEFNTSVLCDGQPVSFKDLSQTVDTILQWDWDFGDGAIAETQHTQHTFQKNSSGISVKLTTTSVHGCIGLISKPLVFNPLPKINFTTGNDCAGKFIDFNNTTTITTGTVANWKWQLGDGATDSLMHTRHSYLLAQNYNVKLKGISDKGCADSLTQSITVYPNPVARYKHTNQCANYINNFIDASSINTNDIIAWQWTFGDGTKSFEKNPMHVYTTDSIYIVTLKVTTSKNCTDSIVKKTPVFPKPKADFSITSPIGCEPLSSKFLLANTKDSTGTYVWNFGDGTIFNGMKPSHIYKKNGSYNVSLKVISSQGCRDSSVQLKAVTVHPKPLANFAPSPTITTLESAQITVKDLSERAVAWRWDFGDGHLASIQNYQHSYSDTGKYRISLLVESKHGCADTISKIIYIKPTFTFYLANAFTPNDDHTNNIFYGYGTGILKYQFMIFDRWGEKIFETTDLNAGWDGTINGRIAQSDTYIYKVELKDVFKRAHIYVGKVTLIR